MLHDLNTDKSDLACGGWHSCQALWTALSMILRQSVIGIIVGSCVNWTINTEFFLCKYIVVHCNKLTVLKMLVPSAHSQDYQAYKTVSAHLQMTVQLHLPSFIWSAGPHLNLHHIAVTPGVVIMTILTYTFIRQVKYWVTLSKFTQLDEWGLPTWLIWLWR